jgi:ferredoxin/flavodoxin---NADP+ reductase
MIYDLIILGAGPAGLYAGFQAGLRNMKAMVIDSLPLPGGLLATFYPDKPVYDIPGFSSIRADDFIKALLNQYARFQTQIPLVLSEKMVSLTKTDQGYVLTNDQGKSYQCQYVLIATGSGTLLPRPLPLDVTSVKDHVHYAMTNLRQFQDKDVVVLGGGDSALDWANTLLPIANNVLIIHRRSDFRALADSVSQFQSKGTILTPYDVSEMKWVDDRIQLAITGVLDQTKQVVTADEIVVCYGFVACPSLYHQWGLHASQEGIVVQPNLETNLANIFAVGNAAAYPGKSKTIATAFGEVASVMEQINGRLNPGKKILYSSFLKL